MPAIATSRFGEVQVDDDEIVTFPDGIVGFAMTTEVVLLPVDQDGLFFWLQDAKNPDVAFLAVTPWPLFPDYEPVLEASDQELLSLDDAAEAIVFCLVSGHGEPRQFTANLLGPVVINERNRTGRQVILHADLPTQAELPQLA